MRARACTPLVRHSRGDHPSPRETWRWRLSLASAVAAAGCAPALVAGVGVGLTGTAARAAAVADGSCATSGLSTTCTFGFTGAPQSWVVPAGVRSATFEVIGAAGGGYRECCGGNGGGVKALTKVVPGTTMQINVGGKGATYTGRGGWNGGGNGGSDIEPHGGGGGGASDVRIAPFTLAMRILVGGGGGGVGAPSLVHGVPRTALGGAGGGSVGGGFQAGQRGDNSLYSPSVGGGGGTNLPGGGGAGGTGGNWDDECGGVRAFSVGGNGGAGAVGGAGGYMRKGGTDHPCYGLGGWGGGGGGGYAGGGGGGGGSEGGAGGGGGSGFGPGTSTSFLGTPGADGQVKVTYLSPSTPSWVSLGGQLGSAPTISERPASGLVDGVQDLFYLSPQNHVIHQTLTAGLQGPAEDLGGPALPGSTIAAVSWAFDRIDVFIRGTDNVIYHNRYDGQRWSGWAPVDPATKVTSSPTVASWGPGRLDVFARGTTGELRHSWSDDGSSFAAFESLQGSLFTAPAAVSWGNNRIDIFAGKATANPAQASLQQKRWDGVWAGWFDIYTAEADLTSVPAVSSAGTGLLDIYFRNGSSGLSRRSFGPGGWSATVNLGPVPAPAGTPPAVASLTNGQQIVLLRGNANNLVARTYP